MVTSADGPTERKENRTKSGQTSASAWALEGDTTTFKKALNPTFDIHRSVALHRVSPSSHRLVHDLSHVLDVSLFYSFRSLTCQKRATSHPCGPSRNASTVLEFDEMLVPVPTMV